jgi:hypothetical protein
MDWAESQVSAVFPNLLFQPTVYCFISEDQLSWLMKNAHGITNLNELWSALESWHFFQSHGAELLRQLQAAYHATEDISSFSAKISQT